MPAGYSPTSRVPREVPAANDSSIEQRRLRLWRRDAEASELSVPGTVESGRLTHQAARREQFALLPTPPRSFFYGLEESFAFPQLVASRQSEPQRLGVQRSFQGYGASAGAAPGLKDAPLVEEDEFTLQVDLLYTDGKRTEIWLCRSQGLRTELPLPLTRPTMNPEFERVL